MKRRELMVGTALALMTARSGRAAPAYPAPEGRPGAPFADVNLKLAILSGLLDKGIIDLGTPVELAEHVLQRPVDYEAEGFDPIPEVRAYLARYPLRPDMLRAADTLTLDGGNAIYSYCWFMWHGEDAYFDVQSLEGLENCPDISTLDLTSLIASVDLAHLAAMPQLRDLSLGVPFENVAALLDMPALRRVRILDDRTYDEVMTPGHPTRAVMERLKARDVDVWVHWMTSTNGRPPAYE